MRRIITLAFLLFTMNAIGQNMNQKIEDPFRKKRIMINTCTRQALVSFPDIKLHYETEYPAYQVDSTLIQQLKPLIAGKKITIILGTWCGDSQLQLPRFLKILDLLKVQEKALQFICVDGQKKAEPGLIERFNITRVPTLIILGENDEIGRITESPTTSLEEDLLSILQQK